MAKKEALLSHVETPQDIGQRQDIAATGLAARVLCCNLSLFLLTKQDAESTPAYIPPLAISLKTR